MALHKLGFQVKSESPLLLHNGQTADPLNKFAKEMKRISGKRAKTDADFEQMAKIEWYASLYTEGGKVCIPVEVWEAAFIGGAKKIKAGQKAQAGLFTAENAILGFDGDNLTIDQLWERDQNRYTTGVRVQRSKVMRTRSRFNQWSAQITLVFDDALLNKSEVGEIVSITGSQIGIGDWRPKFGRFTARLLK